MCRSAIEYPPNGKRCERREHMSAAELVAWKERRNARERELYYLRKAKKQAAAQQVEEVAPVLPAMVEGRASLSRLSQDVEALAGGADKLDAKWVSTDEARGISSRILAGEQPDLAYQSIAGEDTAFQANSVNEVKRVFLHDGSVGYFKNYASAVHEGGGTHSDYGHNILESFNNEVVAYRLSQIMGEGYSRLVPVTVLREYNGQIGTLQAEAEGEVGVHSSWSYDYTADCSPTGLRAVALFDYIAGSQDRHSGNYSVIDNGGDGKDEFVLIDNGFAFPHPSNGQGLYNQLKISDMMLSSGKMVLTKEEKKTVKRVQASLVEGGELYNLLAVGQREFMNTRLTALLRDGCLSHENYVAGLDD